MCSSKNRLYDTLVLATYDKLRLSLYPMQCLYCNFGLRCRYERLRDTASVRDHVPGTLDICGGLNHNFPEREFQ